MPNNLAGMVNYYPSEKYIRKNWAPEEFSAQDLKAIAESENVARKSGTLSNRLAEMLLPNALVENNPSFGVVDAKFGYPPNTARDALFTRLGLKVDKVADGYELPRSNNTTAEQRALMAAAVLSEKARLYGEDKAVERYNGKGRAVEEDYGYSARADSANHARKVQEMARMLQDPLNAAIMQTYRQYRGY